MTWARSGSAWTSASQETPKSSHSSPKKTAHEPPSSTFSASDTAENKTPEATAAAERQRCLAAIRHAAAENRDSAIEAAAYDDSVTYQTIAASFDALADLLDGDTP